MTTYCLSLIFNWDCTRWCTVTLLTHFGNTNQWCWRGPTCLLSPNPCT